MKRYHIYFLIQILCYAAKKTFPLRYKEFWSPEILQDTSPEVEKWNLCWWKMKSSFSNLILFNCACSLTRIHHTDSCCSECMHKYQTLCEFHGNLCTRGISVSLWQQPLQHLWMTRVSAPWVQLFLSLSPEISVSMTSDSTWAADPARQHISHAWYREGCSWSHVYNSEAV